MTSTQLAVGACSAVSSRLKILKFGRYVHLVLTPPFFFQFSGLSTPFPFLRFVSRGFSFSFQNPSKHDIGHGNAFNQSYATSQILCRRKYAGRPTPALCP